MMHAEAVAVEAAVFLFSAAGVMIEDGALPLAGVDVGVDLGGEYAFVPEHLLHGAEVGPVLYEMGGEGVAEGVGGYLLGDACCLALTLDHQKYHLS